MQILIDADFLIALIKKDDKNHLKSIKKLEDFKDVSVFITPFTIPETATVLSYKVSHQSAKDFLKESRKKFTKLSSNDQIINMADEIFLAQNKKGTSWIDCLNVATIKFYDLNGIFSYDKFYSKVGIKIF
ncbi:MAG: PIN domain-containing protein [bacterium]